MAIPTYAGAHFSRFTPCPKLHPRDGHYVENRIITALGAIKADIIRFGVKTRPE